MIDCNRLCRDRRCWILAAAAFVYFVMFPADLEAMLAPPRSVLALSSAVSPWLYGLAAVALACWTARSIWSGTDQVANPERR